MISNKEFAQVMDILIDEAGLPNLDESTSERIEAMFFTFVEDTGNHSYPKEFMFPSNLGTGVKLKQRAQNTPLYIGAYSEGQTSEQAERMIAVSKQISSIFGEGI